MPSASVSVQPKRLRAPVFQPVSTPAATPSPTPPAAQPPRGDTTAAQVQPTQLQPPVRAALTGAVPPPTPAGQVNVPVDADMLAVLERLNVLVPAPIETVDPATARQFPTPADAANEVARRTNIAGLGEPSQAGMGVAVRDTSIPGPAGPLPVRVYRPQGATGPLPVIVYFHGGGWVIADRNVYDGGARGLAKNANAVVMSVEYRRAPEARFPAAHDDALAAYRWVSQNAASIGGDARRLALAGESAGGNLAVATAVAARDARLPAPRHIVAVYPVAQTDTTTPSYAQYALSKPLSRGMIGWFVGYTVRTPADLQDPRLKLTAANLRGLDPMPLKAGSPSVPVPGWNVQVLDADGERAAPGQEGSICVRLPLPPGALPTLWNDDERFRSSYLSAFEGYYLTGDGGYVDEDGYLYVMGRTDDVINVAGHRLSTGAIEAVLAQHPAVAECAVIGVADADTGEAVVAYIVLSPDAASAEKVVDSVRNHCAERLARFKWPRTVNVVSGLPYSATGKVAKGRLRAQARRELLGLK